MITDLLYRLAQSRPDDIALVFGARDYRYRELADMVSRMAARLHDAGVRPGSHVALMCGNRPAFLACWFALGELGAVCVPLNTGLVGDGFQYSLANSAASLLVIEPALLTPREAALATMPQAPARLLIDETMDLPPAAPCPRWPHRPAADEARLNSILFTSGTTGLPKGVALSHGVYTAAGADMSRSLGLTRDDRIMVFLPLFHANPQMYAVASVLTVGATLILLPQFSASRFFDDAIRHRATGFTYVGTVLAILAKHHPAPRHDHRLAWCVGGGAPARVWEAIEPRFGIAVRELYGMTETGGWVSMNTGARTRFGSVGQARDGIRLSIRDDTGAPLPPGAKGEIVAHSERPHVFFSEYWRNPAATAATLKDGWLHTGDRGYLDDDGFLYFDGRQKELIRRGGEMISPAEIEQQLLKHEQVRDCAIGARPDEVLEEELHAFVVASGEPDARALQAFLRDRVPPHMVPRYFSFVPDIPKTETQKIKRHLLTALKADVIDLSTAKR